MKLQFDVDGPNGIAGSVANGQRMDVDFGAEVETAVPIAFVVAVAAEGTHLDPQTELVVVVDDVNDDTGEDETYFAVVVVVVVVVVVAAAVAVVVD